MILETVPTPASRRGLDPPSRALGSTAGWAALFGALLLSLGCVEATDVADRADPSSPIEPAPTERPTGAGLPPDGARPSGDPPEEAGGEEPPADPALDGAGGAPGAPSVAPGAHDEEPDAPLDPPEAPADESDEPGAPDDEPGAPDDEPGAPDEEPGPPDEEPGPSDGEPGAPDDEPPAPDDEPGAPDAPAGCDPEAPGAGLPAVTAPAFSVTVSAPAPIFRALSEAGLNHYPDSAVSFLRVGGGWEVLIAVGRETWRLVGGSPVDLRVAGPALTPTGREADPHHGYAGVTSVVACDGGLTAFFHGEYHAIPVAPSPGCPAPYHASMARATAPPGAGAADFRVDDPAFVLTAAAPAVYRDRKCAYGAGGGSVFDPGGDYLYLYYYDWDAPNGLYLARTCRTDCGRAGTWRKLHGGAFDSEAMAGRFLDPSGPASAVVPASPGAFDAFPTVSYNAYLDAYLMVAATESGIALRVSADGLSWGPRVPVLRHLRAADDELPVLYPTLVDAGTWSRDQTGRDLKLIYAVVSDDLGQRAPHRAFVADLHLSRAGDAPAVDYGLRPLGRYHRAEAADHRVTTAAPAGYAFEGALGRLAANSLPGTHPLYDFVLAERDHLLSQRSDCEGGRSLGIAGFAWSGPGDGRGGLYRCGLPVGGGRVDHFVSADPACEGQIVEGLIGYADLSGGDGAAPPAGPCAPNPAGFFRVAGGGYFSDGTAFCAFASWQDWLAAGGPADADQAPLHGALPACMADHGVCGG